VNESSHRYAGSTVSATASPADPVNFGMMSWRAFLLIASLMLLATLAPFAIYEYPAIQDYPNHLARLHLLHGQVPDGWQSFWAINDHLIPNLALDIICGWLIELGASPNHALRIFCALTYVSLVSGVIAIGAATQRKPPWIALWTFPLGLGLYFLYGLLNYFFSIGLGLWLVALWIWVHERSRAAQWSAAPAVAVAMVCLTVCHLMGYAVAAATIVFIEFGWLREAERGTRVRQFFTRLPMVLTALLPGLLFYIVFFEHTEEGGMVWGQALRAKLVGAVSPFIDYDSRVTIFVGLAFLLSAVVLWRNGAYRSGRWPVWAKLPIFGFLLMIILLPSGLMNSHLLDRRLFVVVFMLAIALHPAVPLKRPVAIALISVVCVVQVVKVVSMSRAYQEQSVALENIRSALDRIPLGKVVGHLNFRYKGTFPAPTLGHAGMFAIIDRAAHMTQLFAWPRDQEWVSFRNEDDIRELTGDYMARNAQKNWFYKCDEYDYLLLTHPVGVQNFQPASCMKEVARGDYYLLLRAEKGLADAQDSQPK